MKYTVFMKKMSGLFVMAGLCCWHTGSLQAQPRKAVEKSTDVLMFAPSAAGLAATLVLKDYKGTGQLALGAATSLATTLLIKYTVSKERPDGSDDHSFPSNHTAVAFQGASFIQRRYGWKYGLPAYMVSTYVAWGRVFARKHDCWDVLGGAAIGIGCSYIYTRPFARKLDLALSPAVFGDDKFGIYASLTF